MEVLATAGRREVAKMLEEARGSAAAVLRSAIVLIWCLCRWLIEFFDEGGLGRGVVKMCE